MVYLFVIIIIIIRENGQSIIMDRTIVADEPYIALVDWFQRRAVLVDYTIPHDENPS